MYLPAEKVSSRDLKIKTYQEDTQFQNYTTHSPFYISIVYRGHACTQ